MCRYYKGENDCPFKDLNEEMLWFYEQSWVINKLKRENMFSSMLEEYICSGLDSFEEFDGIPLTLKALLFNRYAIGCYSRADAVESFKEFYKKYYKNR